MHETIPDEVSRDGTSEQTTVMSCKIQSFSSDAIYVEWRLFNFSLFFFFSPLFDLNSTCKHQKTCRIFCWDRFPLHRHFPFVCRGSFVKRFLHANRMKLFTSGSQSGLPAPFLQQTDRA